MKGKIYLKQWENNFNNCRIPADTRNLNISVQSNRQNAKKYYNYHLQLNRYIIWHQGKKNRQFLVPPQNHFNWWEKWCLPTQQYQAVLGLQAQEYLSHLEIKNFRSLWHLAIGLGQASVYDNALTLHHIYGIPYLPASSIKGLLRNYILNLYFQDREDLALQDAVFRSIFGIEPEHRSALSSADRPAHENTYMKGKVIFFEAFPIQAPEIVADVMTPHYQPYYQEGKPPGDYHDPIIIPFLVVKNTTFQIMIGSTEQEMPRSTVNYLPKDQANSLAELAMKLLTQALGEWGIGAKTTCGYGRMTEV